MSERAYVLISAVEGKVHEILAVLSNSPGIVTVDHVDGPPDVIIIVEADDRLKLARLVINALHTIENMTDDMYCLPINRGNGNQLMN
jgi:hypothetical protein